MLFKKSEIVEMSRFRKRYGFGKMGVNKSIVKKNRNFGKKN